ncbi:MAG TPA: S41 family peptidase [Saprospiraceae bacterium]|nr:S41 family peptidase [Saprospiraceae bacterium]HMQ83454.1 S41 family peptidase [Saprospiraceae bacterium]
MKNSIFIFLFYSAVCLGQEVTYTPSQIREDVHYLHAALKSKHPNLYLYASKQAIDTFFVELASLEDTLDPVAAYNHLTTVSAEIKDGHTLFFPSAERLTYNNEHALFFPLKLLCQEKRLFVEANYGSNESIELGAEILYINGVAVESIIDHCLKRLMRDGENLNYPLWILNNYFFEYYSYFFGNPAYFSLEIINREGHKNTLEIEALPKSEIRANRLKRYGNKAKARGLNQTEKDGITLQLDRSLETAVLAIRDFDNGVLRKLYQQGFKRAIDTHFEAIAQASIKHLVIDLRGNQGGNLENGIYLLSYVLQEKFRLVEAFYVVKQGESANNEVRNKPKKGKGTRFFQPRPDAFKGEVYLLVDGGSFSNSAIVSSAFRHYKRGKIIGEETGGNERVICGYEHIITLPNTQLIVNIPIRQFAIRDKDKNDGHGVMPDYQVRPTIEGLIRDQDEAMDFVMELIRK